MLLFVHMNETCTLRESNEVILLTAAVRSILYANTVNSVNFAQVHCPPCRIFVLRAGVCTRPQMKVTLQIPINS